MLGGWLVDMLVALHHDFSSDSILTNEMPFFILFFFSAIITIESMPQYVRFCSYIPRPPIECYLFNFQSLNNLIQ